MVAMIEYVVGALNHLLWSYILIAFLILVGIYFTLKMRFAQFWLFKDMLIFTVAPRPKEKPTAISSFQAFCISTASRVGTGNIAGVAIAISIGGPGAVFWMWLIALVGAASSMIENILAQVYKIKDGDTYRGGPAYYMQKGLKAKWLGIFFAVLIIFCYGFAFNAVQANTIASSLEHFGFSPVWVSLALASLTGLVIFGGVHRIAHVAQYLVPIMATIYLFLAIFIVFRHIDTLPAILMTICKSAFGWEQAMGGGLGAALMQGIKRGLFSNEAGMGSVPNVGAIAEVSHPVKQGLVQTLGVFVDTLLICSATAFIVLVTGAYTTQGIEGVQIAQIALAIEMGHWASYFLTLCVFLFAFSSIIGNYYYGETNLEFIHNHRGLLFFYRMMVVIFIAMGAVAKLNTVWDIADLFMAFMALTNLLAITLLSKIAIDVFKDYTLQRKKGVDPVFKARAISNLDGTECW